MDSRNYINRKKDLVNRNVGILMTSFAEVLRINSADPIETQKLRRTIDLIRDQIGNFFSEANTLIDANGILMQISPEIIRPDRALKNRTLLMGETHSEELLWFLEMLAIQFTKPRFIDDLQDLTITKYKLMDEEVSSRCPNESFFNLIWPILLSKRSLTDDLSSETVAVKHFVEGFNQSEIANLLNISQAGVSNRLMDQREFISSVILPIAKLSNELERRGLIIRGGSSGWKPQVQICDSDSDTFFELRDNNSNVMAAVRLKFKKIPFYYPQYMGPEGYEAKSSEGQMPIFIPSDPEKWLLGEVEPDGVPNLWGELQPLSTDPSPLKNLTYYQVIIWADGQTTVHPKFDVEEYWSERGIHVTGYQEFYDSLENQSPSLIDILESLTRSEAE